MEKLEIVVDGKRRPMVTLRATITANLSIDGVCSLIDRLSDKVASMRTLTEALDSVTVQPAVTPKT